MKTFAWRVALLTAGILAAGFLFDRLLFASVELAGSPVADLPAAPGMRLAAALLTAAAVAWPAHLSRLAGARLAAALFVAVWGVGTLLPWIEAVVFLDLAAGELAFIAVQGTLAAAVVALLSAWLFGRDPAPALGAPTRSFGAWGWTWRTLVSALTYVVLYLAAGIAVYPFVRHYYETSGQVPDPAILPPLQLARGTLYVLVLLPLVRSLTAGRGGTAFAVACLVPVFAGVAALLLPNPFLPDSIRPYHLVEIGVSNFLYGLLIGWLFWAGYHPAGAAERRTERGTG